jgi:hypothetical protein
MGEKDCAPVFFGRNLKNDLGVIPFLFCLNPMQIAISYLPNYFFVWNYLADQKIDKCLPKRTVNLSF